MLELARRWWARIFAKWAKGVVTILASKAQGERGREVRSGRGRVGRGEGG